MVFKKSMPDLKGVKEKAAGVGDATKAKIESSLQELKNAMGLFEQFGFRASKLKVGMGVIPEVSTSISGSLDKVQAEKIAQLMEQYKDNKLLATMLKALITAKEIRDRVDLPYFTGVKLDVTLGIPPKISFDLQELP